MIEAFASHAAHQFGLSARREDGSTLREHYEAASEDLGCMHPGLIGPELPVPCVRLWADFLELHHARGSNFGGPERIGFRDMLDWQNFRGVKLDGWQITAIQKADDAYFASMPKPKKS